MEVKEEREACQHFVQTSWSGKHNQTLSGSSRGKERRDEVGSGGKSISQSRKNSGYTYDYKKKHIIFNLFDPQFLFTSI